MQDTKPLLLDTDFPAIARDELTTLQFNLGYLCNLSCTHCHVNAGPTRTELATVQTIELVKEFILTQGISCLDLTGGAPEMHPEFKSLVSWARANNVQVIDRCNLTILSEPGFEGLAEFLAEQRVDVVASLPCYSAENVSKQRGKGVFELSIEALQKLNQLGYGKELELNLVYNPVGPNLPPPQQALEADYKRELWEKFEIEFNQLFALANLPIARFGAVLLAQNQFDEYMQLLKDNFSQPNLKTVMCRQILSVDWQGYIYDCDFNQMLELSLPWQASSSGERIASDRAHLSDYIHAKFSGQKIHIGQHCYACTAGQGSSCGGALN